MCIRERFFLLEGEPCVIHLPEKPNGFGILLLGDTNHFVDKSTSLWMQHAGKSRLLEHLRSKGYTIFSSNFYGRHWGSKKAIRLAKRLYYDVMRKEILNENIHIIAEGMGALLAIQLAAELSVIRSIAMINPCLDLKKHVELEKERKFFYKRLIRELKIAYEADETSIGALIEKQSFHHYPSAVPVKVWIAIHERKEFKALYREYERKREREGGLVSSSFYIQEAKYGIGNSICQFYKLYEKDL
ncbi:alpha/beta hydrolase [Bacillus sp. 165]|uniref:alpha/beta hydrolase n=1 Tax=Bacillus sp. 165 TaxID=1529117 RepID=UPI001ADC0424|nr:alpha/beta hydrolase [Bacillus sp. 165]MBO9128662.1 alpha/beta hydrolase [Bacillus sp. 165]